MPGRLLAGGAAVIAAATLVACASSSGSSGTGRSSDTGATSDDVPSRAALSGEATPNGVAAECGSVPTSSGPLTDTAQLSIKAAPIAAAGQAVPVSVTVTSRSSLPRVITTPATSAVLVVRDDRVVGRVVGTQSAPHVPLRLTGAAQPAQAIPTSVGMQSCDTDGNTAALAPGPYALVAVLGYELDSLNAAPDAGTVPPPTGGRSFALVSAPTPITVD